MKRGKNGAFNFDADDCVIVFDVEGAKPPQLYSDRLDGVLNRGDNDMPENLQMGLAFCRFYRDPAFRQTLLAALVADLNRFEDESRFSTDGLLQ